MTNWNPIVIPSSVYCLFAAMMAQWIQNQDSSNRLQIGLVERQTGCMEHAVLTQKIVSHAARPRKDLRMVQINFSNAFRSLPNHLILGK
jgi:hypothetical protein